jgi:hypothetical protein
MNKLLVLASALLLAITLTSCKSFLFIWEVRVDNRVDPVPVRVCTGELTASVVLGTQVNLTATAGPGDATREEARPAGGWRTGDPLVLEATCTDEDGSEVGYARVEGRVAPPQYTGQTGSTHAYPPPASGGGALYSMCLTPTVQRGEPLCLIDDLVIPD